jgi:hypothetical protein
MSVRAFLAVVLAIALFSSAIILPFILPSALMPEVFSTQMLTKDEQDRIHLQIDVRKSFVDWLQIIFTAATAAGLIVTFWYTAKNYKVASENLRVTEYSKFSEAYFKSIELLGGKDDVSKVVATIHALGRLGLSSPEEDRHVLTILCDYARRVAPHRISASGKPADMAGQDVIPGELKSEVQAVLDVLRVRKTLLGNAPNILNLERTRLSGGDLSGADLKYAILEDCDLRGINLRGADLRYARMARTLLNNATLDGADLRRADLRTTDLDSVRLVSVKLRGTKLSGARGTVICTGTRRSCQQRRETGLHWQK